MIRVRNIINEKHPIVDIPDHWMDGPLGASYEVISWDGTDAPPCVQIDPEAPHRGRPKKIVEPELVVEAEPLDENEVVTNEW